MPASNVSLSNISVTPMTSTAPAAGAPGGSALQAGPGGERSFGQWMQQMQSAGGGRRQSGGESLPEEGRILPAQRQAEGARDDAGQAVGGERSNSEGQSVVEATGNPARSDVDVDVEAEAGAAEQVSNTAAEDVLDLEAEEGTPVAVDGSEEEQADPEAAEPVQEGVGGAVDPAVVDTPVVETSPNVVAGTVGEGSGGTVESGQAGVVSPVPGQPTEADDGVSNLADDAGPATAGAREDSSSRPDVREAALQNRGHSGESGAVSPQNHGQQVSAVARSGSRAGEALDPLQAMTAESGAAGGEEVAESAVTDVESAVMPVQGVGAAAGADEQVQEVTGRAESTGPKTELTTADPAVQPKAAGDAAQVVPQVPAAAQRDAGDRAQSARDTVARSGSVQISTAGAQQNIVAGADSEVSAGNGDHGSGAQSEARGGNRFADLQQSVATAGDKGANARNDAGTQAVAGHNTAASGGDSRASIESGGGTVGSTVQSAQVSAGSVMTSSAAMQRLQDPAWSRAMGQRAIMMAQYGPRTAEIQLDPPELGAMQIRIHLGAQDQVSVSFSSPHPAVRDAIEQQMPRLREMFAEQGLELGQSSVSDQSARGGGDGSSQARGHGGSENYADPDGGVETPVSLQSVPVGLVDYYA